MGKVREFPMNKAEMRQRAEKLQSERAAQSHENLDDLTPEQIHHMLHELRVHQIELEMQNEELRTAEARIEAERARYFRLFELAPVGYCTMNELGLITKANLALARLLGRTRAELLKKPMTNFIRPDDQDVFYMHRKNFDESNKSQHCELQLLKPNAETMWVHLQTNAAPGNDGDRSAFIVIQDISERKQAMAEIEKQLSEKEILLREVHHRIKNNLSSIESLLSLQKESNDSIEAKEALEGALSRVRSMRVLYNSLLYSSDKSEISFKVYIDKLVDQIVSASSNTQNISIEKDIDEFGIAPEKGIMIGMIVNELLTNVFKYAFKDRDQGTLSFKAEKTKDKVRIIVRDDGGGSNELTSKNESSGFGLFLVKMLVEQLKGTHETRIENGTESRIEFPCNP